MDGSLPATSQLSVLIRAAVLFARASPGVLLDEQCVSAPFPLPLGFVYFPDPFSRRALPGLSCVPQMWLWIGSSQVRCRNSWSTVLFHALVLVSLQETLLGVAGRCCCSGSGCSDSPEDESWCCQWESGICLPPGMVSVQFCGR